ncbi:hypothetical protein GCM10009099_05950 [Caenispirillum bisanense]
MEQYARSIGDTTWTPYRTEQPVAAVDLTPDHEGEVVADLGRTLRCLPMFRSPRPWEVRREADTMQEYAQERGIKVYSVSFRVSSDCVTHAEFWAAYRAVSIALPEIEAKAAEFGVAVLVGKVHAKPVEGGRLLDTHGHLVVTGTYKHRRQFRAWLRKAYPTGWIGAQPRDAWALSEYLEKPACVGDWDPEWAYKFAQLLAGHRPQSTRHYGDFQAFRNERKQQKGQDGKDKYRRREGASRDGEVIIRIGTCRAQDGRLRPVLFVRGYRGDIATLARKYDLSHALAWAADYANMSQSTAISKNITDTSGQHVNSQQSGHGPPDPDPESTSPEAPF